MSEVTILSYLALFVFVGLFFVSSFMYAVRRDRRQARLTLLREKKSPPYIRFQRLFLKENSVETLLFCTAAVQHVLRVLYLLFSLAAFLEYFGRASLFFWRASTNVGDEVW